MRARTWWQCLSAVPFGHARGEEVYLKDSDSSWWASDAAPNMQWRTGQEKSIPAHLFAPLAKLLEVPHLTDSGTPVNEEPFMKAPPLLELRWPGSESNSIANDRGEVTVIEPSDSLLVGLKTDGDTVITRTTLALRFVGIAVIVSHVEKLRN